MSRSLATLLEKLQRDLSYGAYLALRIDAPPSTPDIVTFLRVDQVPRLEQHLQQYLVGHPYLPSLSELLKQQVKSANSSRALLLATMMLLGLRGAEDELASPDIRTLSNYIDRLGTQMLLSSPRDLHLIMAFELLLSHEPGLVGTAASQFEPQSRGLGLASENLLVAAIKIAREMKIDHATKTTELSSSRLTNLSLWCCLQVWQALYAFLGKNVADIDGLDNDFAASVRLALHTVDEQGRKIPDAPKLQDANGPTASSYNEMRQFCARMEQQHGTDGFLRSAGRTVLSLRVLAAFHLFDAVRQIKAIHLDKDLSPEEKGARMRSLHTQTTGHLLTIRDQSDEQLGE